MISTILFIVVILKEIFVATFSCAFSSLLRRHNYKTVKLLNNLINIKWILFEETINNFYFLFYYLYSYFIINGTQKNS